MDVGLWEELRGKLGSARVSKPLIVGMGALLAIAAFLAVGMLAGLRPHESFSVQVSASSAASAEGEQQSEASTLFVHVSGEVAHPGLYELAAGSRVADAIGAAGGFTEAASEASCNLARIVEDGEHVIVLSKDATAPIGQEGGGAQGQAQASMVNINAASVEQLESLPGIGEATARKIVADRTANGPFASTDDLARVSGIGARKLEALNGLICV